MSNVLFKSCVPNGYKLIHEGTVYIFDITNKLVKTDILLPMHYNGAIPVNIISVLSTRDSLDLGLSAGKIFKRFSVTGSDYLQLVGHLRLTKGLITTLFRVDKIDNIRYEQALFIFPSNFNITSVISTLQGSLGLSLGA